MNFSNSYLQLGEPFYESVAPTPVDDPKLLLWNEPVAAELGIELDPDADAGYLAEVFSGNRTAPGSSPVALAYAGHQFGHFVPQLGDGRAHLLGELTDANGIAQDIQLKGSGRTRFSRGGDGRCGLGPAVREYIMSEALHAMGVPTARSLAVVLTGESVLRQTAQPGAVVTRVATSHLRVGTLQYFAARDQQEQVQALADYAIERHYPGLQDNGPNRFLGLLEQVLDRQVRLVTEWMRIGFIHGVMNTDNTALSGQTIDYGPCAMMNAFDPATVYSSIDTQGRYAFGNQPAIAQWNMARLAECLLPLVDPDPKAAADRLNPILQSFADKFRHSWYSMMGRKLGIDDFADSDQALVDDLLELMKTHELDYTNTFRKLAQAADSEDEIPASELTDWIPAWRKRVSGQEGGIEAAQRLMAKTNPAVIPRNHHVEAVLADCAQSRAGSCVEPFLGVLRAPYDPGPEASRYQDPPADGDRGYQTFCGT